MQVSAIARTGRNPASANTAATLRIFLTESSFAFTQRVGFSCISKPLSDVMPLSPQGKVLVPIGTRYEV
jgi:hypothetical protein